MAARIKKIYEYTATVFGLGYFPVASGTVGSLAGLLLVFLLHKFVIAYILAFIVLFAAGVVSSDKKEAELDTKDPSCVIIDELACIFPVFLFIPLTPLYLVTGFLLYRIIDIVKVPPMKRLENIKGGWGIMLDDLVGGIYTNILLQILILIL